MNINTTKIKSDATNLKAEIDLINAEYKKIKPILTNLKKGWEGSKADAFFESMEDTFLPEFEQAIKLMRNYYKYLTNIPTVYETLDSSYSTKKIGA